MKHLLIIALLLIALPAGAATATWTHDGLNVMGFTLWFFQTSTPANVYNKSVAGAAIRSMVIDDSYFAPGVEYSFYMTAYNAIDKSANSAIVKWTRTGTAYTPPVDKFPTSLYLKPNGVNTIVIDITP
jgi:hypothetical protein